MKEACKDLAKNYIGVRLLMKLREVIENEKA